MAWWRKAVVGLGLMVALGGSARADEASDFTLRDVNGQEVVLSKLEGNVVVMSFWATWCGPCKEEMPHLFKMYEAHKAEGLVVLSISTDDARSVSKVKPFIQKMGYTFPVLLDRESSVISAYNPAKTLPYTVVVDRAGQVVRRTSGYNPGDEVELEQFVVSQLAAAPASAPAPAPAPAEPAPATP
ncbi:MAG: TlpA family protein disulfide reductase [Alphaproteobacteria bacterium]|nr:TlpA family protein disulfide reductase [Alphaproteobacteria bacterium]MCB9697245.1 TlpA family protein disulfide reductase [Alphaproteobacteria bacterium]